MPGFQAFSAVPERPTEPQHHPAGGWPATFQKQPPGTRKATMGGPRGEKPSRTRGLRVWSTCSHSLSDLRRPKSRRASSPWSPQLHIQHATSSEDPFALVWVTPRSRLHLSFWIPLRIRSALRHIILYNIILCIQYCIILHYVNIILCVIYIYIYIYIYTHVPQH